MEKQQKVDVYQLVTDRVLQQLEHGVVPWRKSWVAAGIPRNAVTKRAYRGINVWLLASLGYTHNHFLTFKQVKECGGKISKGQKSVPVVFWNWKEVTDDATKEVKKIPFLRYYLVFNVEQCEDLPAYLFPEAIPARQHDTIEECEAVVQGIPNCPDINHRGNQPLYNPLQDSIEVPLPENFDSAEEYYSTLFHELVHATGHESRLHRKGLLEMQELGADAYSFEELIAEMGATYLNAITGIEEAVFENNVAYINGWMQRLKEDKKLLVQAAGKAQQAVDYLLKVPPPGKVAESVSAEKMVE